MQIQRLAAFSDGNAGGNPAGVVITDHHPSESDMQQIAADIGYSETAFAAPTDGGWRVRYFAPESEVPFCGHATIALGAALAMQSGPDVYALTLNDANITVEGFVTENGYAAALQSPATRSNPVDPAIAAQALQLFGYTESDIDPKMPPARVFAGAEHLVVGLSSRATLSAMAYELNAGREFMQDNALVTVMFVFAESDQRFHSRNAFASGGVYEDPATGAASAAFAGYLRDLQWPHDGRIDIVQGEDMGARSMINAEFSVDPGTSIRVSGAVRSIE